MYIPKKMEGKITLQSEFEYSFEDDFDDILEECGLWITQERIMLGDKVPEYTWELFDKIKRRRWKEITNK